LDGEIRSEKDECEEKENKGDGTSGKTAKGRLVKDGQNKLYEGPRQNKDALCGQVKGEKPVVLKGRYASDFMSKVLPERCFRGKETFLLIRTSNSDVEWIQQHIIRKNLEEEDLVTVYNPKSEHEVTTSEHKLENFLQRGTGCLITSGALYNGMEARTVVLVFENPYSSIFRSNYMRASVKLIMIDRNTLGSREILDEDLVKAVKERDHETIHSLIDNGADLYLETVDGLSILHVAASIKDNVEVINVLIDNKADIHIRCTDTGKTPLHFAVMTPFFI